MVSVYRLVPPVATAPPHDDGALVVPLRGRQDA
jgi:hypothetical protein